MGSNRYRLKKDEEELLIQYRTIKQKSQDLGISIKDVKHGWFKNKDASMFFKNPLYDDGKLNVNDIDFNEIFADCKPIKIEKIKSQNLYGLFDRLVFADVHIGMDASDGGKSLYDLTWTKEDILSNLQNMINHTVSNQKSNKLYIVDLADFLDGYNGQTTRGGHELPQNMSNREAFDLGLQFKTVLLESLLPYYDEIIFHNVNNDNHAGSFAEILNSAFKTYVDKVYPGVEVINQDKFLDYTIVDKYCFVTTHGKDNKHMKHGFKAKLDTAQINKITEYLEAKDLINKGYDIIFEKGDSHQYIFDTASSDIFKYYNFPAFSPSSNWVQTNFKKGKSGFVLFNYYENRKSINDYFF
ncbi:hypothetical protein HZP32_14550 [Elizabethkingia anophelis]|nr:hypothetical protein [Elizabethkingia anophelis]